MLGKKYKFGKKMELKNIYFVKQLENEFFCEEIEFSQTSPVSLFLKNVFEKKTLQASVLSQTIYSFYSLKVENVNLELSGGFYIKEINEEERTELDFLSIDENSAKQKLMENELEIYRQIYQNGGR